MKLSHDASSVEINPLDKLLAKLSEQQTVLKSQSEAMKNVEETMVSRLRTAEYVSTACSAPLTPAEDAFNSTAPTTGPPSASVDDMTGTSLGEVARLKVELEAAKGRIARMDQELAQTRITKHTIDQAIGNASEADFPLNPLMEDRPNLLPPSLRPQLQREGSWAVQDDARSDTSDALSASGFNRARAIWSNGVNKSAFHAIQGAVPPFQPSAEVSQAQWMNRSYGQPFVEGPMPPVSYNGPPPVNAFRNDRMMPDPELLMAPPAGRRGVGGGRFNNRSSAGSYPPYASSNSSFDGYTPSSTPYSSVAGMNGGSASMGPPMGPIGMSTAMAMSASMYGGYQPQPIGTPLSPHAPEFTSTSASWKGEVSLI